MKATTTIISALCLSASDAFQQTRPVPYQKVHRASIARQMKPTSFENDELKRPSARGGRSPTSYSKPKSIFSDRSPITSLSVASLENVEPVSSAGTPSSIVSQLQNSLPKNIESGKQFDAIGKVLSASLLVTGNTVGSSMFVLPEAVGGVGLFPGSGIFFGKFSFPLLLLLPFQC